MLREIHFVTSDRKENTEKQIKNTPRTSFQMTYVKVQLSQFRLNLQQRQSYGMCDCIIIIHRELAVVSNEISTNLHRPC